MQQQQGRVCAKFTYNLESLFNPCTFSFLRRRRTFGRAHSVRQKKRCRRGDVVELAHRLVQGGPGVAQTWNNQ